jgi:hypothetical protein
MELLQFVKLLPEDLVLAPIYRKGAKMYSGKEAIGKNPVEAAHKRNLNRDDAALIVEKSQSVGAIGLWTGTKGNGVVILDVDRNHDALSRSWGDSLAGAPVVRSTKRNAAKYIFRVPEALWREVGGFGLREDTGHAYEVLWGRQGLIYGEYPGSTDGKAKAGHYSFEGDLDNIPDAPGWLIAEMKAAKSPDGKGFIKNRSALDLSDRTEDEVAQIVQECLNVITHQGIGSREHWVKVGMAIHSVLPNDLGLTLWAGWSADDPEYHDEWVDSNPCEEPWQSFKPGGVGLGSLIWMADQVDPKRTRFTAISKQILEAAEVNRITLNRDVVLSFDEIVRRGMAIYEGDDVARMNYELHALAMEARYKDQSGVEKLLLDHMTQQNKGARHTMVERQSQRRDFLIPGLLPSPYSILFFGEAGCGKSATAIALMKHVVDGLPFPLKDQVVPVEAGPVIYFNGDMSEQDFEEEFDLHEIKNQKDFYFEPDFNLYRRMQFVKTMNEVKPKMICIDSLSSCSGAKAGDENKAEFAQPLYWLNNSNGSLWPACTIVVLHHAAKHGGHRGSTAITAAVSEVWKIDVPGPNSGLGQDQRVITVGKSRINRKGETLVQSQLDDLTVSIQEVKKKEEVQTKAGTVAERIMNRLQTHDGWMSRTELNSDPLVGGSVSAIKKTLQRLENRGVVEVSEKPSKQGKPTKLYRALRAHAHGESNKGGQPLESPLPNSISRGDTSNVTSASSTECPPSDLSTGAVSEPADNCPPCSRARTQEELNGTLDQDQWG